VYGVTPTKTAVLGRRLVSAVAVLVLASTFIVTFAKPAHATVVAPRTPTGLPAAIEPLAQYVEQTACSPITRTGTASLATLLRRTYTDTTTATVYGCGTDGTRSEHYDGRAIDWMVSALDAHHLAEANAAIKWLLATDSHAHTFAMARRLGVMYLIFDNRMWGAWSGKWEEYNNCLHRPSHADDNACHRTHVHISLSWNGALGHTTFWGSGVHLTDFGPCRYADLNWAQYMSHVNLIPCVLHPVVRATTGSTATKVALVRYSGSAVRNGWLGGPAVSAVQSALHLAPTGVFSLATDTAVKAFQKAHALTQSGVMNAATWRLLLAATK